VGNVRAALFNWLYARRHGGRFILRLDDTDRVRSKPEYEAAIGRDLTWLGLDWDAKERQSDRLSLYGPRLRGNDASYKMKLCRLFFFRARKAHDVSRSEAQPGSVSLRSHLIRE
jgi:glutamyl-tRNA synthetase